MYCGGCGAPNTEGNNFCKQCGKSLIQAAASEPQIAGSQDTAPRQQFHPAPTIIAIGCLIIWLLSLAILNRQDGERKTSTTRQEPPSAGVTLHAYDLLKDPYSYKGKMVVLDAFSQPMLVNEEVFQYTPSASNSSSSAGMIRLGYTGLRFKRMLSEDQALYDVTGTEQSFSDQLLGQIVVVSSSVSPRDLALNLKWEVEPLGSSEGTNALGGAVTAPLVRFWRYSKEK